VPFVRPVTRQDIADVELQVFAPGDEVTEYVVIAAPPLLGSVHDTTDWPFSAEVAVTSTGALGTVDGTTAVDAADASELPLALVAVTVNV
jgi:hypothetical protein